MADPVMTEGAVTNPNLVADKAIENRDVGALTQIAKDNIGTPASDVALRLAKTIQENSTKFNQMVAPIEKAGGPATPDGRMQIANTFQTVADNPQWGTALLKYVMGDKAGAVKQITGGDITKKVTYDNAGNQILETHNALGEPISYFDRKLNRNLSAEEYAERVGGISSWENTLKGQTEKKVREESAGLMVKEEQQANNWYQLLNSHRPLLEENFNALKTFKSDIDPALYNQIVGSVSQSMGQANARSSNKSVLGQLSDSLQKGESVKVDDRLISALKLNPKLIGTTLEVRGDHLVSKDNSFSVNASKLKQLQESDNVSSEATKSAASTMASIAEAERLKKLNPVQAQRLRRVIETSQQMGRELSDATEKFGKPSIISLPTASSFVDKQAQTLAQTLQSLHNADQMSEYIKFRNNAMEGHKQSNTVPLPGQIGTAFTMQPLAKEIRKFYGSEIDKIMGDEYTARRVLRDTAIDVKFPQQSAPAAQPAAQPAARPVAPPKETLPKGVPAGSVPNGWTPDGQRVYKAPNGKLHTGDK